MFCREGVVVLVVRWAERASKRDRERRTNCIRRHDARTSTSVRVVVGCGKNCTTAGCFFCCVFPPTPALLHSVCDVCSVKLCVVSFFLVVLHLNLPRGVLYSCILQLCGSWSVCIDVLRFVWFFGLFCFVLMYSVDCSIFFFI